MTITGAVVRDNYLTGIAIDANGTVTLSNMEVIANGLGGDQNGIDVDTNGHNMLVQNSVISGNGKNGIYADLGSGGFTLTVKKTYYMGNNRYNPMTDNDENIHLSALDVLVIVPVVNQDFF